MDDQTAARLEAIVRQRLETARPEILNSLGHIASGNPLASEPSKPRRLNRLQAKADLTRPEAEMVARGIDAVSMQREAAPILEGVKQPGPEAIIGPTLDFVGVAFLERGRRAADAVARVAFQNGDPQGSGFLVAPGLFLTNNHVVSSPSFAQGLRVEFDYEYDTLNSVRAITRFAFDPARCFVTSGIEGLDYTLIALGARLAGPRELDLFGYIPLSDATDKHMLGELANVIQHPRGRHKEVVLRENRLVSRNDTVQVLHYIADTEQGSSGSPVFNNDWEAIALHHWGGPYREVAAPDGRPLDREINEGIRISAIVKDLRRRAAGLSGTVGASVNEALRMWDTFARPTPTSGGRPGDLREEAATARGSRQNFDGSVTWTFPIEISVRAPLLGATQALPPPPEIPAVAADFADGAAEAVAAWKTEDFSDRGGYEPGFIPGFVVPLPTLENVVHRIAVNQEAKPNEDPHELRYHHMSIVMNAERRLAFFTACNIDGSRIKAINREKKTVIENPTLRDLGVESMGVEGAEASDAFRRDRRILLEEQMTREFYEDQKVAGFPDPQSKERIARIFQKGHITLRSDPSWGTETEATAAERDTFWYTNAAPQLGFFNQGSRLDRPGSKGKLRWRAVETFVLRNAVTMRQRIGVFAGPVFSDDDPDYRFDSKIPMQFWKIALWAEDDALRAIALLANQEPLIEVMPEAIAGGSEAFTENLELARVAEFLSTIAEIESLTGLNFGDEVRNADVRAGAAPQSVAAQDLSPDDLRPRARRKTRPQGRRGGTRKAKQ